MFAVVVGEEHPVCVAPGPLEVVAAVTVRGVLDGDPETTVPVVGGPLAGAPVDVCPVIGVIVPVVVAGTALTGVGVVLVGVVGNVTVGVPDGTGSWPPVVVAPDAGIVETERGALETEPGWLTIVPDGGVPVATPPLAGALCVATAATPPPAAIRSFDKYTA